MITGDPVIRLEPLDRVELRVTLETLNEQGVRQLAHTFIDSIPEICVYELLVKQKSSVRKMILRAFDRHMRGNDVKTSG